LEFWARKVSSAQQVAPVPELEPVPDELEETVPITDFIVPDLGSYVRRKTKTMTKSAQIHVFIF